jgi:hypothetical protein
MAIEPFSDERDVLEGLERAFTLERDLVIGIAQDFNALASMFEKVATDGENEMAAGRVVVLGLINHTHQLLIGGLHSLQVGNGHVWSACVRGLMEIFGACVLILENPQIAPNFLQHVKAGKLRAAAERGKPGLGTDIDRLNEIVHPGPRAILAGIKAADVETRSAHFHFGLKLPTVYEGREGVIVLGNLADLIVGKLNALSSKSEALLSGKTKVIRTR